MSFVTLTTVAQNIIVIDTSAIIPPNNVKFNYKQIIIPTVLIGYGFVGLNSGDLKRINVDIRDEVVKNVHQQTNIDDYLEFAPALSVYALNAVGIKGKHNFKDRTVILATTLLFLNVTVKSLKNITKINRPNNSNDDAFPSGHTAIAFAGAEFMYQEYKDQSVWYGIAGYVTAATTGVLRIYNNKHWLTDVVAGAGFGMLSTKAAYWLSPFMNRHIFPSMSGKTTAMFMPTFDGKQMGGAFVMSF